MFSSDFPSLAAKQFYVIYDCRNDEDPCSFTCIALNKGESKTSSWTISPHPSTVNPDPVLSRFTAVALGFNIYMIGGCCRLGLCPDRIRFPFHPHNNVRVFNALKPEDGWKEMAPMHLPRLRPSTVVIDGKIYVFGGLTVEDPEDGEYFDPDTNKWHRFSAPGCRTVFPLIQAQYVDPKGERSIIIHTDSSEKLFSYSMETRKWEILSHEFGNCHRPAALLDGVIYALLVFDYNYKDPRLSAYDLIQKRWFPVKVPGLDDAGSKISYWTAWVIATGSDRLCLLWFHKYLNEERKFIKNVECLELEISKNYSDSTTGSGVMSNLTATILSKTYFPVEDLSLLEKILHL